MMPKTHMIELDEAIAAALKKRADERGVSVPDLVAQYLDEDQAPVDGDTEQVRELDRRWAAVQAGQPTIKHEKVVRWLDSWGTSAFKPWRDQ